MDPKEITLLCLVLCLGQRIQAQEGDFPMPFISTSSSPVVPWGGSVKIQCQAIPDAYLTRLMMLKNSTYKKRDEKLGFWNDTTPEFIIDHMDANKAGRYQCQYRIGLSSFRYSDTLELVVTDSINRDYTMQNLIRMAVAGLVLVALLAIVVENWRSHKALNKEAPADVAEPSWSYQMCQPGWTFAQTPSVCK
ncbi:immunoglobulin alpha Fc receptor isoform X5 [Trachypithecus francoisi]|uniref:immunoglobulin alpha Fc receptor isoform X5 n=1 Tax=Trachypithecus francoisi TaxID=54180 RepID=UPI00141A900F|nr:immunoglobulin alpha Fc receptor isoform X5 [Trachypithecus francoisi]